MSNYAVFGYGSLILPPSAVSRFADLPPIDAVYEAGLTQGDNGLVRSEAISEWERRRGDFTVIPVRVSGFCRTYTYESPRGGTMLEATYTGEESDVMNGVIISGYTEEEYDAITATEDGYDQIELTADEFEAYTGESISLPHPITVYVSGETNWTQYPFQYRNSTYHARILAGIDMLGEMYTRDLEETFRAEFRRQTYEPPLAGGRPPSTETEDSVSWKNWLNTVRENDRLRDNVSRLWGQ